MLRKFLLVIIVCLFIYTLSFGQSNSEILKKYVDTSNISVLACTIEGHPLKNCSLTTITESDLIDIEILLRETINDYNLEQARQRNAQINKEKNPHLVLLIDLKLFKRQYVASTNTKGEKEVWLNCFCDPLGQDWKKEIIKNRSSERRCNFSVTINLTTSKCDFRLYQLTSNN